MGDASEFFDANVRGLSDPEKYNLYSGLSEMADELSALHDRINGLWGKADELSALRDQMNKLSEMTGELSALHDQMNQLSEMTGELSALHDQMNKSSEMAGELSALHDQMNQLEAAVAKIARDMRELRKSLRVVGPRSPELRIKSRRRQPVAEV